MVKRIVKKLFSKIYKPSTKIIITPLSSNEQLKGKSVLITGGSSGIGFSIAKRCIESGANVIITGRNEANLQEATVELGAKSAYIVHDISDIKRMDWLIKEADSKFKEELVCLVSNAGVPSQEENFLKTKVEDYEKLMAINLEGPYFLCKSFIKHLNDIQIGGSIVLVSSNAAQINYPADYALSKAGIAKLGKGLAVAYASKLIRANVICPGFTISNILPEFKKEKTDNMYLGSVKDKRWHLPEEVAEIVAFLLSDASICLNGQVITCDGGDYLR